MSVVDGTNFAQKRGQNSTFDFSPRDQLGIGQITDMSIYGCDGKEDVLVSPIDSLVGPVEPLIAMVHASILYRAKCEEFETRVVNYRRSTLMEMRACGPIIPC